MSNRTSTSAYSYNIIGDLEVTIDVTGNPFNIPIEALFQMAARINKKRSFLFVSRVLGKHLPVNPYVSLLSGASLGMLYQLFNGKALPYEIQDVVAAFSQPERAKEIYERVKGEPLQVEEPTLFIGFAETATALGHSMFDRFAGETSFIHTTRESLYDRKSVISFEEEHSHATSHRCYSCDPALLQGTGPIVLVDDEITTGKTSLNIIKELHQAFPRKRYVVASLLDWRSPTDQAKFAELESELGISIDCISLIQGQITVSGQPDLAISNSSLSQSPSYQPQYVVHDVSRYMEHVVYTSVNTQGEYNEEPYLLGTGRFGLKHGDLAALDESLQQCAAYLASQRIGEQSLCIGMGEFMYIPMRIAAEMGEGVSYQSSTRSPIYPYAEQGYAVNEVFPFHFPEDASIKGYFYNVTQGAYDEIFVFVERDSSPERLSSYLAAVRSTGIPVIHVVHFTAIERREG